MFEDRLKEQDKMIAWLTEENKGMAQGDTCKKFLDIFFSEDGQLKCRVCEETDGEFRYTLSPWTLY